MLQNSSAAADLDDQTVLFGTDYANAYGVHDGQVLRLGTPDGPEATVAIGQYDGPTALMTPGLMDAVAPDTPVNGAWIKLSDGADEADAVRTSNDLNDALSRIGEADPQAPLAAVEGTALERASLDQVINTLLTIVLGLLGVAVVIAFVGVANTLSLSVLERRRESAMLRAMGLTRGQLRGMLAIEGVLIALIGTLIGVVAGLAYGRAGATVILG